MESVVQHIGLKYREFRQLFAKQKCLRDIWGFFDRRENDLLKQEIRTVRTLDKIIFFPIDGNETEFFDGFAEIFFNQNPELYNIDFSQILEGFDFSSIPIDFFATFFGW